MDEVIPPEPFYGFYSIDVENFISQSHTFLLKIPSSQFLNEQLPIFLVWLQKIFQFLTAVPEREKYFPPLTQGTSLGNDSTFLFPGNLRINVHTACLLC